MDDDQKRNLSIANSSGFPFQIATAEQVRSWQTPWNPELIEHPWRLEEIGAGGYIDLVLQAGQWSSDRLVVECKRQRGDARWIFFQPSEKTVDVRYLATQSDSPIAYLESGQFFPSSVSSAFCAMAGEDSGRRPSLERTCDTLLQSVEALAAEELRLERELAFFRYLPVVLTNARLFVCQFDPLDMPLSPGELPEGSQFEEVGYVRFEKPLWVRPSETPAANVAAARRLHERTVFVISGGSLRNFLKLARHHE